MMSSFLLFFKKYRWAFLSGLMVGTSYIPFPPWALFFCYSPLWFFLATDKELSLKNVFVASWITQFTLTLIGFHWIAYLTHEFGQLPWVIAVSALLLFATLVHLYIPISFVIGKWIQKKFNLSVVSTFFIFALILSGFERIWPSIFPWHLGYVLLSSKIPMYQWADTIGFAGLSTIVLLINATFASIYFLYENQKPIKKWLFVLGGFFVFINLTGFFKGQEITLALQSSKDHLAITSIQANVGNFEKAMAEQGSNVHHFIIEKFLNLTTKAAEEFPDTDLWIWPETAYPDFLNKENPQNQNFNFLVEKLLPLKKPLLTGAYSKDPPQNIGRRNVYNGVFLIGADGSELTPPYHKTQLLVFGEYLPFEEYLAWFAKFISFSSSFGRGPGPTALALPNSAKLGIQICYEGLDPEFTRGLSLQGTEIITNHTNDSWFGVPFEPLQHMYMTMARGIEVRRPLVRSTNTGISTAILANGDFLQKSPTHVEWYGQFKIPYIKNPPQTFFVLWGHLDYVLWILLFIGITLRGRKHDSAPQS